jgi:hypothetical protein
MPPGRPGGLILKTDSNFPFFPIGGQVGPPATASPDCCSQSSYVVLWRPSPPLFAQEEAEVVVFVQRRPPPPLLFAPEEAEVVATASPGCCEREHCLESSADRLELMLRATDAARGSETSSSSPRCHRQCRLHRPKKNSKCRLVSCLAGWDDYCRRKRKQSREHPGQGFQVCH